MRVLGRGESYTAWLLEAGGSSSLVVRVPRRPVAELPRPIGEEFAALSVVPGGTGPAPVLLEERYDNPLGSPYMVTGYVPGRERAAGEWDARLLGAHVRQVARLHRRGFDRCGAITAPLRERSVKLSLGDRFASGLAWWRRARPDVLADPEVSRLLPRVESFVAAAEPAFERLDRFAVVHGDLMLPNILVDEEGMPRYIDWEWSEIGDPAQDLAYLGGQVWAPPWYLPLDRGQVRALLESYVRETGGESGQGEETVGSLEVRRAAWEVYERFLSSLHFRTRRNCPEDVRTRRYTDAVAMLTTGLDDLLR
ncbi:phosphotransferase [Streptomyces sp. MST-110588]|uniref:phosphotransferase family protein n=1 Tax=Streptomyces sp. MST-110588 TaxID=2833628 RepID=UPI001F5C7D7C|nr:phosphotransferase [Streptomyces sp. MST-110588]UNO43276.1 phosphotransferase [Streptomyces sp. MST-110588]